MDSYRSAGAQRPEYARGQYPNIGKRRHLRPRNCVATYYPTTNGEVTAAAVAKLRQAVTKSSAGNCRAIHNSDQLPHQCEILHGSVDRALALLTIVLAAAVNALPEQPTTFAANRRSK